MNFSDHEIVAVVHGILARAEKALEEGHINIDEKSGMKSGLIALIVTLGIPVVFTEPGSERKKEDLN